MPARLPARQPASPPGHCYFKGRVMEGGRIVKGQLLRSQADRAGYENPGEDCGRPHQTVGVNRRCPVWLRPRQRHYRRNLCCQAAAREVSSCQQETLHGFCRPGGVWSSTSEGHLWALRKLGVAEWIVQLVQGMYANARSRIRVGEGYSEEFEVNVGVHQGSVLSPLLFIIVLEALSQEFRSGVPWEDLYADDLVIIAESLEDCVRRLLTWKEAMEKKGLRVNAGKTKIMICGTGLDLLQSSGCMPLGWQTTEGSPGQTWQAWGGSFLLLLRRHALSSRWLWTFNHNTWKAWAWEA